MKWPIPNRPDYQTIRRMVNVAGNPPFDILCDRLMDFASIAAAALGRTDWENFRRLVLVHVADCPSTCWYCFNDAWDPRKAKRAAQAGYNKPEARCTVGPITAKEIVKHFKEQQERDNKLEGKQSNVLRLSGGEPFHSQPGLVENLAREIQQYSDVFLWVDTNLVPIARRLKEKETIAALEALSLLNERVAIHACFHGVTDEKIREDTGLRTVTVEMLLEAYDLLRSYNLQVYPRLNPCTCTPLDAERFFIQLYDRDRIAPAKLYLGPIELYYPASRDRMNEVKNDRRRKEPRLHPGTATIFWWNKMMQLAYGVGYGVIPRHLCDQLWDPDKMPSTKELAGKFKAQQRHRPDHEFIFVSKGSGRESYTLKILEALVLPLGARMTLELEGKYVEPNLREHSQIFPGVYENKDVLIVATHDEGRGVFHVSALRWAKLRRILTTPSATTLEVELRSYPGGSWNAEEMMQTNVKKGLETYDFLASYSGRGNLPIDGYFCQLMALPNVWAPRESETLSKEEEVAQADAFLRATECLNEATDDQLKKNVYYRVAEIELSRAGDVRQAQFINGEFRCHPGDRICLELDTFNRNLGRRGYPQESMAALQVECTEPAIKLVSQSPIRLSKFGRPVIELSVPAEYREFTGYIVLRQAVEGARIAEVRLPFVVEVEEFA